jgi:hypothetical protein
MGRGENELLLQHGANLRVDSIEQSDVTRPIQIKATVV